MLNNIIPEPKPWVKNWPCPVLYKIRSVFLKFFVIGADNKTKVKNMAISAYQINNVLRVYGEQLRQGRISNRHRSEDTNAPDKISISVRAARKTIIDDTTTKPKKKIR